jgi:hypothetical protein
MPIPRDGSVMHNEVITEKFLTSWLQKLFLNFNLHESDLDKFRQFFVPTDWAATNYRQKLCQILRIEWWHMVSATAPHVL